MTVSHYVLSANLLMIWHKMHKIMLIYKLMNLLKDHHIIKCLFEFVFREIS